MAEFSVTFEGTMRGRGSLATPEIQQATASIRNLRIATEGPDLVADGPLELSYAAGRIRVGHVSLDAGGSTLEVNGEIPVTDEGSPGSVAVNGMFRLDTVPQFLPALGPARMSGVAELNASLRGSASNLQAAGSVIIRDAGFHSDLLPFPIENIAGKIEIEEGLIRLNEISGSARKGTLRAQGSIPLRLLSEFFPAPAVNPGQPARLSARVQNVQLSGGVASHPSTTTLTFDVVGEAPALELAAWRGTIVFDELAMMTDDHDLRQTAPTRIEFANAGVRLGRLDLKGRNGSVHGSASLGLTGKFSAPGRTGSGGRFGGPFSFPAAHREQRRRTA